MDNLATKSSRAAVRAVLAEAKGSAIVVRPVAVHSRSRKHRRDEAVRKGRHTGFGKRKGTANARLPYKTIWMRRLRVLRRMLSRYREAKKIDSHLYHELYLQVKGNRYKTKKSLMETIHKLKAERLRLKTIEDQAMAAKEKSLKRKNKAGEVKSKSDKERYGTA